jgi:hypothetical protein
MANIFWVLLAIGIFAGIIVHVAQYVYEERTRKKIMVLFKENELEFKEIRKEIFHEVLYCFKEVKKRGIKSDELNKALRNGIWHIVVQVLVVLTWIGICILWLFVM